MNIGGYEVQVPFVTTSSDSLKTIVEFAKYKSSPSKQCHAELDSASHEIPKLVRNYTLPTAIDLRSGDGRVALELSKNGFLVFTPKENSSNLTNS